MCLYLDVHSRLVRQFLMWCSGGMESTLDARASAFSFPGIPVWLSIQIRCVRVPEALRVSVNLHILWAKGFLFERGTALMACKADLESEKM